MGHSRVPLSREQHLPNPLTIGDLMTTNELLALTAYFAAVLLLWTPIIIDTIKQDNRLKNKGE